MYFDERAHVVAKRGGHERDPSAPQGLVSGGAAGRWRPATGCSCACARPADGCTLDQAAAIAEGALACGNGAIGLSARANLQVRGVERTTLPDLHARLGAAGLLDADPEVERLRNILVSPLSDIDPDAAFDLAPSRRRAGGASSRRTRALRLLPAKFSFVSMRAGGCRSPMSTRTSASRPRATAASHRSRSFLAAKTASPRSRCAGRNRRRRVAARARFSFPRRRTARRRAGCARLSRASGRERYSPRPGSRRDPRAALAPPRIVARRSRRRTLSARSSSSARRRRLAKSTPAVFKALIERARARAPTA